MIAHKGAKVNICVPAVTIGITRAGAIARWPSRVEHVGKLDGKGCPLNSKYGVWRGCNAGPRAS